MILISSHCFNSLFSKLANLPVESGSWEPAIPRATFTTSDGKYYRIGNVVYLNATLTISASQTSNAYLDYSCLPSFGKTRRYATGTWYDNTTDKNGTIASSGNMNARFCYQGGSHPLTEHVGHNVLINISYPLY